ncbi:MAG: 3-phosphoshikimate 1-carboxyvinyltransferase [Capsulimonadales bacterium]|nr:3-phosphoshikimate 1-carboxyvinyltransferase [Capsulimonadales bacterium]
METRPILPTDRPLSGTIPVPGSKSITNRALVLAGLCAGTTTLTNALFADDTARMRDCLGALGVSVKSDAVAETMTVVGTAGRFPIADASLFVGNSGTTARFITPVAALATATIFLDGVARMRERPMGDLIHALHQLGVRVESVGANDCPPIRMEAGGLHGGECVIRSDASSQFLSGLLLAAPCADGEETIVRVEGPILSAPYLRITVEMVRAFGGRIEVSGDGRTYRIPGRQSYISPERYSIEPDASSASYFWAAAAMTAGRVRVPGIGRNALQGDAAFVDVLEAMGCDVVRGEDFIEVTGPDRLSGVTWDMNAISDTVMTLAAIAPFADGPTRIENVGHIRHKETDRLRAVATELRRLGVEVEERADGLTIYPTAVFRPATVETYDDHRMAMSFALIGLRVAGVAIADPDCVAKTFPDYFERLERLRNG